MISKETNLVNDTTRQEGSAAAKEYLISTDLSPAPNPLDVSFRKQRSDAYVDCNIGNYRGSSPGANDFSEGKKGNRDVILQIQNKEADVSLQSSYPF